MVQGSSAAAALHPQADALLESTDHFDEAARLDRLLWLGVEDIGAIGKGLWVSLAGLSPEQEHDLDRVMRARDEACVP